MKKILCVSNYYYPYISGLNELERIEAEQYVKRGYDVTVITSRHSKDLPKKEIINGVNVIRCDIWLKISKGVISPEYILSVIKFSKKANVVNLHLPMLESGLLSLCIKKEKLLTMYHCDINLPKSLINNFIVACMDVSHKICLIRSKKIAVTSLDYAIHSRIASKYSNKLVEIGAPIKEIVGNDTKTEKCNMKIIGFCGRIVEEKGIDILLKAFRLIQKERKDVKLVIAGDYSQVAGGSIYPKLTKYIEENRILNVEFLGKIKEDEMWNFYSSLDVFTLPSINSLEAFGLVQIEAMLCGIPVVASDLYGVRTIVQKTGMGLITEKGNYEDLAKCILKVINNKDKYLKKKEDILKIFSTEKTMNKLIEMFEDD